MQAARQVWMTVLECSWIATGNQWTVERTRRLNMPVFGFKYHTVAEMAL
jgi:hypothetical protein